VALDVGALAAPLEVVDGNAVCRGDAQRLAGAARGFAVGGPAQHEFRRAIERWPEHLEDVARVEVLDEAREPGEGGMVRGGDLARPAPEFVPERSGMKDARRAAPARYRQEDLRRVAPAPRSNALSAPIAWPERRT
jgi:hypothetical protein